LKNTLEVLDLSMNSNLTNKSVVHCRDLVTLNKLSLYSCVGIDNLSPLKDCLNLEQLEVWGCHGLADDSFKVFSEEPNSFPNLRSLNLTDCNKLTERVFEHLSKNNHLVHQLKELNAEGMYEILSSSATARKNICQLKGLRRLEGTVFYDFSGALKQDFELVTELTRGLRNIEEIQ